MALLLAGYAVFVIYKSNVKKPLPTQPSAGGLSQSEKDAILNALKASEPQKAPVKPKSELTQQEKDEILEQLKATAPQKAPASSNDELTQQEKDAILQELKSQNTVMSSK